MASPMPWIIIGHLKRDVPSMLKHVPKEPTYTTAYKRLAGLLSDGFVAVFRGKNSNWNNDDAQ